MKSVLWLVALLSRLVGLFPVTADFRFSRTLFVRSVICGVISNAIAALHLTKVKYDWIRYCHSIILILALVSAWAVFWKRAPGGFDKISVALLELERLCPARPRFPWAIHSPLFFGLCKLVASLVTAGAILPFPITGQLLCRTFSQSIISLFPLQFAIFTDLIRQVFLELERMVPCLYLDGEALILLRHLHLCRLFQRLAEFYIPHILFSLVPLAVACSTYVYIAVYEFRALKLLFITLEISCNFFTVFFMVHAFARLQTQVVSFNNKVSEAVLLNPELVSNPRISLFVEYNPTLIIKSYTFSLDYSLVIELLGLMATWNLIFLQFKDVKLERGKSVANGAIWNQTTTAGLS